MGKTLKILGIVFLVVIAGFVCMLIWSHGKGSELQEKFCTAIGTGDAGKVIELMDPRLKENVDRPILQMWVNEVNAKLGKYEGLSKSNFHTSSSTSGNQTVVKSEGTAIYEKGEAQLMLVELNEMLVEFNMTTDRIPGADWFKKPEGIFYRDRAIAFIDHMVSKRMDQARDMMHEILKKQFDVDRAKAHMVNQLARMGEVKSIKFLSEKFTPGKSPELKIFMTVEGSKKTIKADVRFQFVGLKGHIVGFNVPSD